MDNSKVWYRSVTFWSLIVTIIGLILQAVGSGQTVGEIVANPTILDTLGEILTALGLTGAVIGRTKATQPLTLRAQKPPTDKDGGSGPLNSLLVIGAVLLVGLAPGCIARQVRAEESIGVDIKRGPPCVVTVTADGAVASTVTGPECRIALPETVDE